MCALCVGGLADQGESIPAAAHREVLEESGVSALFRCVLIFRHVFPFHFACADIYVICLMEPQGTDEIHFDPNEIRACRWMPVSLPSLSLSLSLILLFSLRFALIILPDSRWFRWFSTSNENFPFS